jgi:two-component system, NtrC family, nitrogen regulation response regulator GlnG
MKSGEFTTVGGNRPIKANVRIVAATNKNLMDRVEAGSFREDLYYRLNVIPISLPPLRQRQEDVALLARYFLGKAANEGLPQKSLSASAIDHLIAHDWPGNVRELENLMRRLAILARDDVISGDLILQFLNQGGGGEVRSTSSGSGPIGLEASVTQHVSEYFSSFGRGMPPDGLYHRFAAIMEKPLLLETMQRCNGNQIKAAKLLGLNRNTIRKKLSDHGIDVAHGRKRIG